MSVAKTFLIGGKITEESRAHEPITGIQICSETVCSNAPVIAEREERDWLETEKAATFTTVLDTSYGHHTSEPAMGVLVLISFNYYFLVGFGLDKTVSCEPMRPNIYWALRYHLPVSRSARL